MIRKSLAGIIGLPAILAIFIAGPWFLASPKQAAGNGQTISISTPEPNPVMGRVMAAVALQQAEDELVAAAAEAGHRRREAEKQAEAQAARQKEAESKLAEAHMWAERYRKQQREVATKQGVIEDSEALAFIYPPKQAPALADRPVETDMDRQIAEGLARKYRNDEKGMVAEARALSQGVPLDTKIAQGPAKETTGSVTPCKTCGAAAMPQTKAKRRSKIAAAPMARVHPGRSTSPGCPMLAWVQARL